LNGCTMASTFFIEVAPPLSGWVVVRWPARLPAVQGEVQGEHVHSRLPKEAE